MNELNECEILFSLCFVVARAERGEFLHKLSIEYVKDELRIPFCQIKKVKKPLKVGGEKNVFLRSFFPSNLDQDVLLYAVSLSFCSLLKNAFVFLFPD